MAQKILYLLVLLGAVLCGVGVILFFNHRVCYAQTPYYGPTSPVEGLIPVQIHIYDSSELGGVTIEEASFTGQSIPLKPSGLRGFRGGGSFRQAPGSYDLIWTVSRTGTDWPRMIKHKQKIRINKTDVWVQIEINGETASVM
jgi:hypothetical protein